MDHSHLQRNPKIEANQPLVLSIINILLMKTQPWRFRSATTIGFSEHIAFLTKFGNWPTKGIGPLKEGFFQEKLPMTKILESDIQQF